MPKEIKVDNKIYQLVKSNVGCKECAFTNNNVLCNKYPCMLLNEDTSPEYFIWKLKTDKNGN